MSIYQRFQDKVMPEPMSGCWLWIGSLSRGYGEFCYANKKMKAHRTSYQIYKSEIPKGLSVLHRCDNKSCVNPDHLFLGTQADNIRDMVTKGRMVISKGESTKCNKLVSDDILQIRKLKSSGITGVQISKIFNVHSSTVYAVLNGLTWRHI